MTIKYNLCISADNEKPKEYDVAGKCTNLLQMNLDTKIFKIVGANELEFAAILKNNVRVLVGFHGVKDDDKNIGTAHGNGNGKVEADGVLAAIGGKIVNFAEQFGDAHTDINGVNIHVFMLVCYGAQYADQLKYEIDDARPKEGDSKVNESDICYASTHVVNQGNVSLNIWNDLGKVPDDCPSLKDELTAEEVTQYESIAINASDESDNLLEI